jgi:exosortase A
MRYATRAFTYTVATILAGVLACWPTLESLAGYWENLSMRTYAHGYIVAAICVWLVWRARGLVDAAQCAPCWPALAATAALSFLWYLAWIAGVEIGYQALFPAILLAAVAGVVGLQAAKVVRFAILYLYCAIPIWSYLNEALRVLTTTGVTWMTRVTAVPAYIEGNTVFIPSGAVKIAEGCSGLRYFVATIAVAALYGELERCRMRHRVLLLAVAAGMAVLMNWVRVYGIVLDGYLTDMKGKLVTSDHELYGWLLFGLLLIAIFWVARHLVPAVDSTPEAPREVKPPRRLPIAFTAALVALAVGPALTAVARARSADGTGRSISLPDGASGWSGPVPAGNGWSPVYPNADIEAVGEYRNEGQVVAAYVNGYAYQAQGHEPVGYGDSVLGASGWRTDGRRTRAARAVDGGIPYVELFATAPDKERWAIGYFYVVGGRILTGEAASKLYYGFAVLKGLSWSGVVAVGSKCGVDCSKASATLDRFLSGNGSRLAGAIPRGRGDT